MHVFIINMGAREVRLVVCPWSLEGLGLSELGSGGELLIQAGSVTLSAQLCSSCPPCGTPGTAWLPARAGSPLPRTVLLSCLGSAGYKLSCALAKLGWALVNLWERVPCLWSEIKLHIHGSNIIMCFSFAPGHPPPRTKNEIWEQVRSLKTISLETWWIPVVSFILLEQRFFSTFNFPATIITSYFSCSFDHSSWRFY